MRAIRVHDYGGPDVLRLDELPTPAPGEGQALVRVEAAGVNFIEIYQREAAHAAYRRPLPFALGAEGAGVVEAVGPGVSGVEPGERVASTALQGAYATHALAPAQSLVRVPDPVSTRDAAAVLLQGMTAHYLVHDTYPLGPGSTCLIHAAAGGVGLLFCQMAKILGASLVLGTTSTEAKAQLARMAGADHVILYTQQDFVAEVKRITDGRGVDAVYDSVGADTFLRSLDCLRPRGYMVLFGQSSGPAPTIDPQILQTKGSIFLTRPTLAHYISDPVELQRRSGQVFGWLLEGKLRVRIDEAYPLDKAADAQRALASRRTSGKLLLLPPG
jgi:NADPH:quinone reductase